MSLSTRSTFPSQSFEQTKWLSLAILTAVESQGVRKFTLALPTPHDQIKKDLRLWVFTPDLLVSTSALETPEPVRVAKILWKTEEPVEGEEDLTARLSRQALAEGELSLSDEEVERLVEALRKSGEWLPRGAREFAGWSVGLLERFGRADVEAR